MKSELDEALAVVQQKKAVLLKATEAAQAAAKDHQAAVEVATNLYAQWQEMIAELIPVNATAGRVR